MPCRKTVYSDNNTTASTFSFEIFVLGRNVCFVLPCGLDSLFSEYPGLPDMKQIGRQTQHAATLEAINQTASTDCSRLRSFVLWWNNSLTRARVKTQVRVGNCLEDGAQMDLKKEAARAGVWFAINKEIANVYVSLLIYSIVLGIACHLLISRRVY